MSRNIYQIYLFIAFIVRKQQNVFLKINDCMSALDAAQMELYEDFFKLYGLNQTIHDGLKPFIVYQPFTSANDGKVTYPLDYQHLLAGVFTITGSTVNPVRFVQTDEYPNAVTAQVRKVTLSSPIAIDNGTGFSLIPQSTQSGAYYYLRRPAQPILAFSQSGTDNRTITYNSSGSTQIEFLDAYINNIIARALKYVGVFLNEQEVEQFAILQQKETD